MIKTEVIRVDGMMCANCQQAVEEALNGLDGVSKAEVNLEEKNVTVEYDDSKIQREKMALMIDEIGYDVID